MGVLEVAVLVAEEKVIGGVERVAALVGPDTLPVILEVDLVLLGAREEVLRADLTHPAQWLNTGVGLPVPGVDHYVREQHPFGVGRRDADLVFADELDTVAL